MMNRWAKKEWRRRCINPSNISIQEECRYDCHDTARGSNDANIIQGAGKCLLHRSETLPGSEWISLQQTNQKSIGFYTSIQWHAM
jgi:hypothetical protein